MNRAPFAARYTGMRSVPFAPPGLFPHGHEGHCRSCGQPSGLCHCGCRQCRSESKELLVDPSSRDKLISQQGMALGLFQASTGLVGAVNDAEARASAFIGGGCCVNISVEYAPTTPTSESKVLVAVADTEGTTLSWERSEKAGANYTVKENIITTKPGATLIVAVSGMVARVRWCEVFSC